MTTATEINNAVPCPHAKAFVRITSEVLVLIYFLLL